MLVPEPDFAAVLQRVIDGDRLALVQASRLVNGFLVRWNAYVFREEWEDLVQEVICAAALALREGRIRDRQALVAFLMSYGALQVRGSAADSARSPQGRATPLGRRRRAL